MDSVETVDRRQDSWCHKEKTCFFTCSKAPLYSAIKEYMWFCGPILRVTGLLKIIMNTNVVVKLDFVTHGDIKNNREMIQFYNARILNNTCCPILSKNK